MDTWKEENSQLVKDFEFKDFSEAIAFVNMVAKLAEEANHHPDILIHDYKKVQLTLSTHTENAVTQKDHDLAERIDALEL